MRTCPSCGQGNPVQAKFCSECGAAMEVARELRRIVTVLFSDVTDSTALAEGSDPEKIRRVMSRYFEEVTQIVESHHGTVEKFIGDAVMAVFGLPKAHEDDALRAVRAAVDLRQAIERLNIELEAERGIRIAIRTGINTGEVVAGDANVRQALVTGDTVNVAARLEQAAAPGEILIGESTLRLTEYALEGDTVPEVHAKGKAEPLRAFRVSSVRATVPRRPRHLDSPLVGRAEELLQLERVWDEAVSKKRCRLVTIVGDPGVGKTRLATEFRNTRGGATVLTGRCLAYGDGITYWPLIEVLSQAAGLQESDHGSTATSKLRTLLGDDPDGELIASLLAVLVGVSDAPARTEDLAWAVRKTFASIASRGPLLVEIDDIHWAEATLLDLIAGIADYSEDRPIVLTALARPELLEDRPTWAALPEATTVTLEGLSENESSNLIDNLLGQTELPADVRARITATAAGTPLFVEEIVSMLIDEKKLVRRNGRWVPAMDLATLEIPPTLQSLLAARLDRLDGPQREVLERAAIIGKDFSREAVAYLSELDQVDGHLDELNGKRFVAPTFEGVGSTEWAFRHILIRDAAYESMPKDRRRQLHERFADWLEATSSDRLLEHDEIAAYHLETAVGYASELGPLGAEDKAIAARAAQLLERAARRAFSRGDIPASATLSERAFALMAEDQPQRVEMLLQLADTHTTMGLFTEANAYLDDARSANERFDDPRLDVLVQLQELNVTMMASDATDVSLVERALMDILPAVEAVGDPQALARVWGQMGYIHGIYCRAGAQQEALAKAMSYARQADDLSWEFDTRWWYVFAAAQGPAPPEEMLEIAERWFGPVRGQSRLAEVGDLLIQAHVHACRGDADAAFETHLRSRALALELGYTVVGWSGVMETAWMLTPFEDFERALAVLQEGDAELARMGETAFRSTVLMEEATVLYELGRYEEAGAALDEASRLSWSNDIVNEIILREVRAKLLAREGRADEAVDMAREALRIFDEAESDFTNLQGRALFDLSETYRLTGRMDEAAAAATEALSLFEAKGYRPWCERIHRQLERIGANVGTR